MSERYELSWTWNSAAAGCHAALEEIDVPYSLRFIDLTQPLPPDYLALNPHGKLPVLIDKQPQSGAESLVLYQSAAILLYLAENHPEAELLPPVGTPERGLCYQWMFYLAEMLQPSMLLVFYPERSTTDDSENAISACTNKGSLWTADILGRLDGVIGSGPYMLGDRFSICDLYLTTMCRWLKGDDNFPPLSDFPRVEALVAHVLERPAVQRMTAKHYRDE